MPLPSWAAAASGGDVSGSPTGQFFMPPSSDTVLREHYWFWKNGTENSTKSTKQLVDTYLTSVGHASNLILNIAPNKTGGLPEGDIVRYARAAMLMMTYALSAHVCSIVC